jgi:hypothetical protein
MINVGVGSSLAGGRGDKLALRGAPLRVTVDEMSELVEFSVSSDLVRAAIRGAKQRGMDVAGARSRGSNGRTAAGLKETVRAVCGALVTSFSGEPRVVPAMMADLLSRPHGPTVRIFQRYLPRAGQRRWLAAWKSES